MKLRVGITGAGTAGPALALLLAKHVPKRGTWLDQVTLFDKWAVPEAVGAGILLQPPALAVLHELGLSDEILSYGASVFRVRGQVPGERMVLNLDYRNIHPDLHGIGLHRSVLHRALLRSVKATRSCRLQLGVDIVDCRVNDKQEKYLIDSQGREYGPFDLVVGADGAKSNLRTKLTCQPDRFAGRCSSEMYRWAGMWSIVQLPKQLQYQQYAGTLQQFYDTTRLFCGFLPTGALESPSDARRCVTLFWSVEVDKVEQLRRAGLQAFKENCIGLAGDYGQAVLDQIHSLDQLLLATYYDTRMYPYGTRDGVMFIGDAAHSMNPALGNGANLALKDAQVLAQLIIRWMDERHEQHKVDPAEDHSWRRFQSVLQEYSQNRRPHVGYYQWVSRTINPLFQADSNYLHWMRDYIMGPSNHVPIVGDVLRYHMLLSLVGAKTGWSRRLKPDPISRVLDLYPGHQLGRFGDCWPQPPPVTTSRMFGLNQRYLLHVQ